jgi:hypothetical protein
MQQDHFKVLSSLSTQKLESIHRNLDSRNISSSYSVITSILTDKVIVKGNLYKIYRLFIRTLSSHDFANIGWVIEDNVMVCLLCGENFLQHGKDQKRFHCYACGNLVCERCITLGQLEGLNLNDSFVNTCCQCNFGQVGVFDQFRQSFHSLLFSVGIYSITTKYFKWLSLLYS